MKTHCKKDTNHLQHCWQVWTASHWTKQVWSQFLHCVLLVFRVLVGVLYYWVVCTKFQALEILVLVRSYLQSECAYYNEGHNELSFVCIFWIFVDVFLTANNIGILFLQLACYLYWLFSTWFKFKCNRIIISIKQWHNNIHHRNFDNILGWRFNFTLVFVRTDWFCTIGYQFITRKIFLGDLFLGFSLLRRPLQIENAFISGSVISFDLVW